MHTMTPFTSTLGRPLETRASRSDGGFALVVTLLVALVAATLIAGALSVGASNTLSNRYYENHSQLVTSSRTGIEYGRSTLNSDRGLFPESGYVVLEDGVSVSDGEGGTLPGVQRWTYAGPTGNTTGQYGVFGSIVSVTRDAGQGVAIRRSQVRQESFARYAYFTDIEPTNIAFGGGDQIFGPVHSNSDIKIYNSGATFHDEVRTAGGVQGEPYATFVEGYEAGVSPIPLPPTAELDKLESLATSGGMAFDGGGGSWGQSGLRLHFVVIDLDGDGSFTGEDEGWVRVYESSDPDWVTANRPGGNFGSSDNCGDYANHGGDFVAAADHPEDGHQWWQGITHSSRRCYLGGSDELNPGGGFVANDGRGEWLQYTTTPDPRIAGRADANYLFPLSRRVNPDFKGVIHIDGKAVISGVLRGRVTIAATDQIIIGDDITYAGGPAQPDCPDILGLFSGNDVVVADNTVNAPSRAWSSTAYRTYDDTKDEYINAIVLALNQFTVENYNSGSETAEPCETTIWGRGCLFLTGGIIQRTRGAVGLSSGDGYLKRYSYDQCGASDPPPYFPTTGYFFRDQLYPVDPVGFDVGSYFDFLSSGG